MGKPGRPSKTFIESKAPLRCTVDTPVMLNFDMALKRLGKGRSEIVQELVEIWSDQVNALGPSDPEKACIFFNEGKCDAKNPIVRVGKTQGLLCQNPQFHGVCKRKLEGKWELMDKK